MGRTLPLHLLLSEIADVVGEDDVTIREVDKLAYAQDYFWLGQMWLDRNEEPSRPDIICSPESTEEVSRIMKIATRYRVPVIPYGGGSGTQGGIIPLYGGIMLDVKKMCKIIKVDKESLTATVQAGLNVVHLEEELNRQGLTWAHYPASAAVASVGGCIAARGTGTLSTKYGKAEDLVLSIELVLASGEVIRTLHTPNHACGPGLLQLFVGAEGTLGVITEVTVKLDPMPAVRRFNGYLFQDLKKALEAGRLIMTRRLRPCTLRLYDANSTKKLVKRVLNMDIEGSFLITGCDGEPEMVEIEEKIIDRICQEHGGKPQGQKAGEQWWENRYKFYFPPYAPGMPSMIGTIETITTYDKIYDLYLNKKKNIEGEYKEYGVNYTGHFSHWYPWGTALYDRFYIDTPPADAKEALLLHNRIWATAARTNLEFGGLINEHHGIGLKLGRFMPEQYGNAWGEAMVKIKDALDPIGIMNPGKLGFGPPKG